MLGITDALYFAPSGLEIWGDFVTPGASPQADIFRTVGARERACSISERVSFEVWMLLKQNRELWISWDEDPSRGSGLPGKTPGHSTIGERKRSSDIIAFGSLAKA